MSTDPGRVAPGVGRSGRSIAPLDSLDEEPEDADAEQNAG
jgi:hypothetical protein